MYVRQARGFLDNNFHYQLYEGKDKIVELMHALNCKGIREKSLHDSIHYFIKEGVIREVQNEPEEEAFNEELLVEHQEEVTVDSIKLEILDIEKKFSNYLSLRNCRWAHKSIR